MHADEEKKTSETSESLAPDMSHHEHVKDTPIARAVLQEHEMTLKHVLVHHKKVAWWCFYWAMCAVGWYVCFRFAFFGGHIPCLRWMQ